MEALSPTMEEGRLVEWKKKEGDAVAAGDVAGRGRDRQGGHGAGRARRRACCASSRRRRGRDGAGRARWSAIDRRRRTRTSRNRWAARGAAAGGCGSRPAPAAAPAAGCRAAAPAAAPVPASRQRLAVHPTAPAPPPTAGRRVKASPLARRLAADTGPRPRRSSAAPGPTAGSSSATSKRGARRTAPRRRPSLPPAAPRAPAASPTCRSPRSARRSPSGSASPSARSHLLPHRRDRHGARLGGARAARMALGDGGQGLLQRHRREGGGRWRCAQHPAVQRLVAGRPDPATTDDVHLGMAVAVEDGLITPVIRHADRKSLREIAAESKDAGRAGARAQAQAGGVHRRDVLASPTSGCSTSTQFTAIINPPEAGILAVGAIAQQPVVVGRRGDGAAHGCGSR